MKKLLLLLLCVNISGCGIPSESNNTEKEYTLPNKIEDNTKLSVDNLQAFNTKASLSDIKSWFKYYLVKYHKIVIDKVMISDTTQRVDDEGNAELIPDYAGKVINLSIKGKFDKDVVKPDNILFKNESGLINISYVGEIVPRTKVLIDDSIMLEPISATTSEIKVKFSSEGVSDYYLKGLHKLSIISDRDRTDTLIKIGTPVKSTVSLAPVIDEIKLIRKKDIYLDINSLGFAFKTQGIIEDTLELAKYKSDTPINIKIKGKNFPMFYKFSYSLIDSKFGFGHNSAISKDASGNTIWESIIHIPQPLEFEKKNEHSLSYSTPFGTSIKRF